MTQQIITPSRKVIKDLVVRHVDEEKNHDCIKWKIKNFSSLLTNKSIQSPMFTVGTADECKWYLDLQLNRAFVGDSVIPYTCYLILDRDSDCKETSIKWNFLFIGGTQTPHVCKNSLDAGRTCKFIKKSDSERKAGMCGACRTSITEDTLIIACEIMIQSVVPEIGNLSSDLESLLKNQLSSDVVISIGGKNYPAHKLILAARSPVFAAMFNHDMVEKEDGTVRIEDIDENVAEEMLRYMYTGKLTFKSRYLAQKLLAAAHKYDMKHLLDMCEEIVTENLSCSNALDVLAVAKLFDRKELKSEVINFILDNNMQIMDTEAWKNLQQTDFELVKEICEASFRSMK